MAATPRGLPGSRTQWDHRVVVVELLVVPDCPNERPAREALRAAATLGGVDVPPVTVTVIESAEQARDRGFIGSPTFLIDGKDPFPVPDAPTGMTCRLYATAKGLMGVPDVDALRDALLNA